MEGGLGNEVNYGPPTGTVTEFSTGITARSFPIGIVGAPDGNVWFTEQSTGNIGRITPTGAVTEFVTGIGPGRVADEPGGICVGPDGMLWFTDIGDHAIWTIVP